MNHLQNHIDNYLVHCQTQKRLDAKTLKAYRMRPFQVLCKR
jgi:integrase/recombinase XerD